MPEKLNQMLNNIGREMVKVGLISSDQLAVALESKKNLGGDLGSILIRKGFVTEEQIISFLKEHVKIPFLSIKDDIIDPEVIKIVPISLAQKYHFMPLSRDGDSINIAMARTLDIFAVDDIQAALKMRVRPVLAPANEVEQLLEANYRLMELREESHDEIQCVSTECLETNEETTKRLAEMASGTKIITEVNRIVSNAVKKGASDIHIEPMDRVVRLRYRVDGLLEERLTLPRQMHVPIVTRIKIMSGMDIAERRIPQDGRVRIKAHGSLIDMRVSTYPAMYGEKVVIRLLTKEAIMNLEDLGFSPRDRKCFEGIISKPHGVFLVTGPTGSGKSTTLYVALQRINSQDRNIISIEDPIENEVPGVNQAQTNPKAGLTFASALRSILRQDPDVIMVGEVRDRETADIVVRSAITGHMVFSTLHTNTAIGAVTRLVDLGVERFLISSAVVGLLAQRLVRKICPDCRQPVEIDQERRNSLGIDPMVQVFRGKGCPRCNMTGYSGRVGIFELVDITPAMRELILRNAGEEEMIREAKRSGTMQIREAGIKKVLEGITTVEEVLRVTEE